MVGCTGLCHVTFKYFTLTYVLRVFPCIIFATECVVFMYGNEAWRGENRPRMFYNRVLRKMVGSKEGRGNRGVETTT